MIYGLRYSFALLIGAVAAGLWLWFALPMPSSLAPIAASFEDRDAAVAAFYTLPAFAAMVFVSNILDLLPSSPGAGMGWWKWMLAKPLPRLLMAPVVVVVGFYVVVIVLGVCFGSLCVVGFLIYSVFIDAPPLQRFQVVEVLRLYIPALFIPATLAWLPAGYVSAKESLMEHPRFRRWFSFGRGGSARWAGPRSIRDRIFGFGQDNPRGSRNRSIYLGKSLFEDTFFQEHVGVRDDAHMLTIGCTGAGKSTSVLWPNLAMYEGSVFVLDPKGEHTRKTFWRRNIDLQGAKSTKYCIGNRAWLLDPFGEVPEIPSVRYNPLSEIDINSDRVRAVLSGISDACVLPEDPKNQHFVDMAALMLEGVIAHVLSKHPKEDHNLPFVCDLLIGLDRELGVADPEKFTDLLIEMRTNNVAGGIAQLAASRLDEMGPNERGSVLSTLTRSIKWITDPAMRKHLTASDFSMKEIFGHISQSVYVVLPFNFMKDQSRWMRTITNVTLGLIQNAPDPPSIPILFVLDEFPMLGKIKKIEEGVVTLRSAGVKLWPLIQNIGQLKSTFGANWETFISSSTVQLFGVKDMGTAEWASGMLGKNLLSRSESRGLLRRSRIVHEREGSLATPEEIIEELGKSRPMQFVFPTSGRPMRLQRMAYKPLEVEGNRFKGLPLQGHFEE